MPVEKSGNKSNAKVIRYNLPEYKGDEHIVILDERHCLALLKMCEYLRWRNRHDTLPADLNTMDKLDAWVSDLELRLMERLDLCAIIQDCIGEQLNNLSDTVTNISELVNQVKETQIDNSAKPPTLPETVDTSNQSYNGALAVVREMHRRNELAYQEAEDSLAENSAEWVSVILRAFPDMSSQGVSAGADIAEGHFNNQRIDYLEDYTEFEQPAACELACRIDNEGGQFTIDIWGNWLNDLDVIMPTNRAASVFSRYSTLRQTFLNQIAAIINSESSLQKYFDALFQVYYAGTTGSAVNPCGSCAWEHVSNFDNTLDADNWVIHRNAYTGLIPQAVLLPQGFCATPEMPSRISIQKYATGTGGTHVDTITVTLSGMMNTGDVNRVDICTLIGEHLYSSPIQSSSTTDKTVHVFNVNTTMESIAIDVLQNGASNSGDIMPVSILEVSITGTGVAKFGVNNG